MAQFDAPEAEGIFEIGRKSICGGTRVLRKELLADHRSNCARIAVGQLKPGSADAGRRLIAHNVVNEVAIWPSSWENAAPSD